MAWRDDGRRDVLGQFRCKIARDKIVNKFAALGFIYRKYKGFLCAAWLPRRARALGISESPPCSASCFAIAAHAMSPQMRVQASLSRGEARAKMPGKKPVFLLLDFHYGFWQTNHAMLRQLGYKTHTICGSGHYLLFEWRGHSWRKHFVRWHQSAKAALPARFAHWADRLFVWFYPHFADYLRGAFLQASYQIEGVQPQAAYHDSYAREQFLRHPLIRKSLAASDYVVCSFPPKLAYIAVWLAQHAGKRVFLLAGHRFNAHLRTHEDNAAWKEALRRLASEPHHIVSVYSTYEARYMRHFLPQLKFQTFPLAMMHIAAPKPRRRQRQASERKVLLYDNYGYDGRHPLFAPLRQQADAAPNLRAAGIRFYLRHELFAEAKRDLAPGRFLARLAQCHAIVCFPYSAYSLLFCEFYELNLPLFIPSEAYLLRLAQADARVVQDRALFPFYCSEDAYHKMEPQDTPPQSPNSYHAQALRAWLPQMEYFQRRNIQRFDSIEDLFDKLVQLNRAETQAAMHEENLQRRQEARTLWRRAIAHSWQHAAPQGAQRLP